MAYFERTPARSVNVAEIDGIVEYASTNFAREEKHMKAFGYPGTLEIVNFLKDWLQGLIRGTDKGDSQCFNANGLH